MLKTKFAIVSGLILLVSGSFIVPKAWAEEIVVSGNGSASTNNADVSSNNNTTVTQNNTTNISNDVHTEANTGNNTTSNNTDGSTNVDTGDVSTSTNISNQANQSSVDTANCGCNQSNTNVSVSGNGTGSNNSVNVSQSNNTTTTVNQTANIVNNIHGSANTGGNTAWGNNGNVNIHTGNISVSQSIENGPINISEVNSGGTVNGDVNVSVEGNGAFSKNHINLVTNNENHVYVDNVANIFNNVLFDLNTGDNHVSGNNGDVNLTTGNIDTELHIVNGPINVSKVTTGCGCKEKPVPTPTEKVTPPPAPSSETSSSSSPTQEVASVAIGKVLPATGTNWLFLAFIGNVMMLFLGMILRLRSGNSPGKLAVA